MKLTTILVDDDKIFHFLMDIMLKEIHISDTPLYLLEGKAFLAWFENKRKPEEVALVFLDLNMPLIDGWQVLDYLHKKEAKNIFVVIITSSIDPKDKKRAEAYPMVIDFLVKPIALEDLIALKKHPLLSPYF